MIEILNYQPAIFLGLRVIHLILIAIIGGAYWHSYQPWRKSGGDI